MRIVNDCKTPFFLTGGTALSRFYFHHRYSDDLDYFVNNDERFSTYVDTLFEAFKKNQSRLNYTIEIGQLKKFERYAQLFVKTNEEDPTTLKIDLVNDIETRYGELVQCNLGLVDSWENILSNKLSALYRLEAKDVIDIWIIAKNKPFNWKQIVEQSVSKDAGTDPVTICETLLSFPVELSATIKWAVPFDIQELSGDIQVIAREILSGSDNNLKRS